MLRSGEQGIGRGERTPSRGRKSMGSENPTEENLSGRCERLDWDGVRL